MTGTMGMMSAVSMALYAVITLLVLAVLVVGLMVLLKVNRRLAEDSRDRARARSAAVADDPTGEKTGQAR
jgi:Tfp pilus assembly protein PilX